MKHKLIVGERVFYDGEWYIIAQCVWRNGGRIYTLNHTSCPLTIKDVEEAELLK